MPSFFAFCLLPFLPKTKIEVVINDALLEPAMAAIKQAAYTGKIGDGKIFVTEVEKVLRIRTGEQDEEAL